MPGLQRGAGVGTEGGGRVLSRSLAGAPPEWGPLQRDGERHILRVRRSVLPLSLSAALLPAACGDGAGPTLPATLEITAVTPAAAAPAVETGATVAVVFNQPIDPATLTSATFRVTRDGVPLPTVLSYEEATRTARAAAPFLPDMTYQVEVTTGVRTSANAALSAPEVWGFTTGAWQAATVDAAGSVGLYTSLAVDASGRLHVS